MGLVGFAYISFFLKRGLPMYGKSKYILYLLSLPAFFANDFAQNIYPQYRQYQGEDLQLTKPHFSKNIIIIIKE